MVNKLGELKIEERKWIFKLKIYIEDESKPWFKAKLVVKCFTQKEGLSDIVGRTSIRILLAFVVHLNLELEQIDVKTSFLNGELKETVYMDEPPIFIVHGQERKVYLLKKFSYGLKQSPKLIQRFDPYILSIDFSTSKHDSCVYFKKISCYEFFCIFSCMLIC